MTDSVLQRICKVAPFVFLLTAIGAFPAQEPGAGTKIDAEARAYDQRGVELAQAGNLADAIEQFRSALRLSPDYSQGWYHLGLAYDQAHQTDQAMEGMEEALRLQPSYVEARYMLANTCRKRGDFPGELKTLAQVVTQAPRFAEAHYNYGLALTRSNQTEAAIRELQTAVRLSPATPKYMLALGIALADIDREKSVEVLREAVRQDANSADAHYNLGLALATNGDDAAAEQEFRRSLDLNPRDEPALRALGVTFVHAGKLAQAVKAFRSALGLTPGDAEVANNLGTAELRLKDYGRAIESLEHAIKSNPNLIKAHANLAQAYQRSGRDQDAQHESDRVAALTLQQRNRGQAMIDIQRALEQIMARQTSDALATLRKAIAVSPDFPDAHFELGRLVRDSGGDPNIAIAAFQRVLNLDPERADAHYEMGLSLERAGRKAEAMPEYSISVEMAPCNVIARSALGRAALDAGQWSLAADQYRALMALQPRHEESKRQYELAIAKQKTAR